MAAGAGVVEVAQKEVFLAPLVALGLDLAVVLAVMVSGCHCSCIYPFLSKNKRFKQLIQILQG